jgi:hypothetical protein
MKRSKFALIPRVSAKANMFQSYWADGYEIRAFKDRSKSGLRIVFVHEKDRVLKKSGFIYLHCHFREFLYLKIEYDRILGIRGSQMK